MIKCLEAAAEEEDSEAAESEAAPAGVKEVVAVSVEQLISR
jgi:hypothetical protein